MKHRFPFIDSLKRGKPVLKGIRAFDIETRGLGGEFLAVGWEDAEAEGGVRYSEDWHYFLENILLADTESLWTAHNMGRYESLYLLEENTCAYFVDNGYTVDVIGPKYRPCLISIRNEEQGTEVRIWDSYSLIRLSLAKATEQFNTEYKKASGVIDFDNEDYDHNNHKHREYLRFDVLSLKELVGSFSDYFRGIFGVHPGYSLPSSGVRAWRKTIPGCVQYRNIVNPAEEFIRKAYRGGRVIVTNNRIHGKVTKLDFNSMYPSVMRSSGVPTGHAKSSLTPLDKPGFVHCTVNVPPDSPPWKCVLSDERGFYVTGVFETYCTTEEIKQAEQWGTEIIEFRKGYYFDQTESVFTLFVDLCERERNKAKAAGDKATEQIIKLAQNSLYGKFGMKREAKSIKVSAERLGIPLEVNDGISEYVWEVTGEINSREIMPHWAAWITAEARLKLTREIDKYGLDNFHYADTDSLLVNEYGNPGAETIPANLNNGFIDMVCADRTGARSEDTGANGTNEHGSGRRFTALGNGYGLLKDEGTLHDFFVVAPKTYSGFDLEGNHVYAIKGIPNAKVTREMMLRSLRGETVRVEFMCIRSVKSAMSHGKQLRMNRKCPTPDSTMQYTLDNGYFRPIRV